MVDVSFEMTILALTVNKTFHLRTEMVQKHVELPFDAHN